MDAIDESKKPSTSLEQQAKLSKLLRMWNASKVELNFLRQESEVQAREVQAQEKLHELLSQTNAELNRNVNSLKILIGETEQSDAEQLQQGLDKFTGMIKYAHQTLHALKGNLDLDVHNVLRKEDQTTEIQILRVGVSLSSRNVSVKDVITHVDLHPVHTVASFAELIASKTPGDDVVLGLRKVSFPSLAAYSVKVPVAAESDMGDEDLAKLVAIAHGVVETEEDVIFIQQLETLHNDMPYAHT